jgi:hypothetical protein
MKLIQNTYFVVICILMDKKIRDSLVVNIGKNDFYEIKLTILLSYSF